MTSSTLTVDQALAAARTLGLSAESDERRPGLWLATCPVCVMTTERRRLSISCGSPAPGHSEGELRATISCGSGCPTVEIEEHLRRALAGDHLGADEGPVRFLDVSAMVAQPPPPVAWLAQPLIARASLTTLYAPGGDGKSMLAGALACAIAQGSEVAGISCEEGSTVYLDGENGSTRYGAACTHSACLPRAFVSLTRVASIYAGTSTCSPTCCDSRPDLAVLDSFRSLTPGLDENDTKQTAAALDPLRRLAHESGVAILLIHHANKAGRDFRGASSIRDSVDVLWAMGREGNDRGRSPAVHDLQEDADRGRAKPYCGCALRPTAAASLSTKLRSRRAQHQHSSLTPCAPRFPIAFSPR